MYVDSLPNVAGFKGELPPRVRERFFDVANKRIDELLANGESQARIGERWGVSQNTINKIRQRSGGLGVKVLYGMRIDMRMPIDEILGLPPFSVSDRSELTRSSVRPRSAGS